MPTTTKFIWDEQNYLAEADGTDTINVVYTNEPEQYGNLISNRIGDTTSYYHFDVTNSTRQLTDAAATTTDTFLYDAGGTVLTRAGIPSIPFLWQGSLGYYNDRETGSVTVRRRTYVLRLGAWRSRDLVLSRSSLIVPYVYAANSPVDRTDPSGLQMTGRYKEPTGLAPPNLGQIYFIEPLAPDTFYFQIGIVLTQFDCACVTSTQKWRQIVGIMDVLYRPAARDMDKTFRDKHQHDLVRICDTGPARSDCCCKRTWLVLVYFAFYQGEKQYTTDAINGDRYSMELDVTPCHGNRSTYGWQIPATYEDGPPESVVEWSEGRLDSGPISGRKLLTLNQQATGTFSVKDGRCVIKSLTEFGTPAYSS
jgi:RHS repeat-associated protein